MKTFKSSDILYSVASFNADPYCVETDEQVEEIMKEINEHGAEMLDGDERIDALAKLDLEHTNRIVYKAGACLFSMDDDEYTYDIYFHDETADNNIGCRDTYEKCLDFIRMYNGTDESYFGLYKGGTVEIYCNETEEVVYEEIVK